MGTRSDRGVKSVNLPEDLHHALKQAALDSNETMESCAEAAVRMWRGTQFAASGDPVAYRKLLHAELARLARVDFDPEDVPGRLLIEFDAHWPEGWSWAGDSGWRAYYDDEKADPDTEPLDPEGFYDITSFELEDDGPGPSKPLEGFVREFLAKENR